MLRLIFLSLNMNNLEFTAFNIKNKKFLVFVLISLAITAITLSCFVNFIGWLEHRPGIDLYDPLLALFRPIDLSIPIFIAIYAQIILYAVLSIRKQYMLPIFLISYTIMLLVRMGTLYLLPLNAPIGLIPLSDPIAYGYAGKPLTKDLFFSGHTATSLIMFLSLRNKKYKFVFLFLTIFIGIGVLLQQVHYTLDVYAAPFFGYCAYKLGKFIVYYVYGKIGNIKE